ncbi:MAG TPA: sulfatase, partial [Bacteroidetes bacterium]|nr:sulfatase [Bacteroidota bacterium]HEX04366.1 sulfatase [Bacteroidota bacterium]
MNRRKFIGTTMLGTAALGLPSVLRAQPGEVNILMIVIDDLNDWVGCLGGHPQ